MLEFRTGGFKGHAVRYSPYYDSRLAVVGAQNFGLVGNGRLYILGLTANGIQAEQVFDTQDAAYDLSWSEQNENQVVVGCGDGTIKLFDINVPTFPVANWKSHGREVYSVSWNLASKQTFISSSWDGSVKVHSPLRDTAITVLPTHSCTHSAKYAPRGDGIISAVSSDSKVRVWDLRTPSSAQNHLMMNFPIHTPPSAIPGVAPQQMMPPSEPLTHDWNKYNSTVIAVGGVDRLIRCFDLRNTNAGPYAVLPGHEYAIRNVSWSPHLPDVLMSASYDMSCRIWTDGTTPGQPAVPTDPNAPLANMKYGNGGQIGCMQNHTEFCFGVDWCLFGNEGWCASTAWDERVLVWDARSAMAGSR